MKQRKEGALRRWFFDTGGRSDGSHSAGRASREHPWWQVMCLTGVDYFSTLGYQPGIALVAAGALSPFATLVLVLLTLFGALPMYKRVAEESPYGDGSISMLEKLLSRWKGKLFVLMLLGFVATSFIITITLSSADATAHIVENPYIVSTLGVVEYRVAITLVLVAMLGAVFLRGFGEAIGIAVALVIVYLTLNAVTIGAAWYEIFWVRPELIGRWQSDLWTNPDMGGSIGWIALYSLFLFPKLALGLSGFETGVVVMPLVKTDAADDVAVIAHEPANQNKPEVTTPTAGAHIAGRIANGKKLLSGAAIIMSFYLLGSSIATTMLIPVEAAREGGAASGRALSYLAHTLLGDKFGTAYDISTITILWFAGASAMAGLLNIVPRYLPRYGMAPNWARATRPLVILFTAICFVVTAVFRADVDAQAGAYATGVLALMTSAAVAVTISSRKRRERSWLLYLAITVVFTYTTAVNIVEQPSGLKIATLFIVGIIAASFISRALRTTELRVDKIEFDAAAERFINELDADGELRIVTNRRETGIVGEYRFKEHEKRIDNHIPATDPILFYEIDLGDASEFCGELKIRGIDVEGYKILRTESPAVPNAIAALLLEIRDRTGKIPHVYFGWSEGNPIVYLARYILFGEGDTAPVTREILRQAEEDPELRPNVHVGG